MQYFFKAQIATLMCLLLIGLAPHFTVDAKTDSPITIAHRGASGYLPEHTLAAAVLAYNQGADYIEQDLVMTKDDHLIVLHDVHLDTTTNVKEIFPQRAREDGRYYAIDFTLQEIRALSVHERRDIAGKVVYPTRYSGNASFKVATFREHIEVITTLNRIHQRTVGLYPEIKAPAWHRQQGKDIAAATLTMLREYGLDNPSAKVFLQCFDFDETKRLRNQLGAKVKLVQLIGENDWQESATDYDYLKTAEGLTEVAKVAQGIGPWYAQLIDLATMLPTGLVENAHQHGLVVHPYTFRADQLPYELSAQQTLHVLFEQLAVDGLFTDHTDVVVNFLTP
ncbi:glycerophosphodiester phosphodiesterase [Alteromonas sp. ASW11-36]|uniref:glycerophosphodiester phosphodiesterase n=1 Tax=Alteromonas arenosi TaxID=3055817 RepID=A0ABT7SV36_9ALTE|nr:glycerophosphodiester phosphodiesterase [Alteromonas sp. ASW11-36]MDM7860025.1 glycerophosphodiester phosphodiesterase [Alteromonas sp. ASW11-36]